MRRRIRHRLSRPEIEEIKHTECARGSHEWYPCGTENVVEVYCVYCKERTAKDELSPQWQWKIDEIIKTLVALKRKMTGRTCP